MNQTMKSTCRKTIPATVALLCALLLAGCQTQPASSTGSRPYQFTDFTNAPPSAAVSTPVSTPAGTTAATNSLALREGDMLRIIFPGAPSLNTDQQIRRDGMITLPQGGELKAVGKTPAELEAELLKLFGPQLQIKEVSVTVSSAVFPVYVTGAVLRPGKIMSDRPITALEAVMEAGGFDYTKANLKAVVIVRHEDGQVRNFTLNLKLPLDGKKSEPFYLKPSDIVYVKEKFSLF